jgi:hypothetical protein
VEEGRRRVGVANACMAGVGCAVGATAAVAAVRIAIGAGIVGIAAGVVVVVVEISCIGLARAGLVADAVAADRTSGARSASVARRSRALVSR